MERSLYRGYRVYISDVSGLWFTIHLRLIGRDLSINRWHFPLCFPRVLANDFISSTILSISSSISVSEPYSNKIKTLIPCLKRVKKIALSDNMSYVT